MELVWANSEYNRHSYVLSEDINQKTVDIYFGRGGARLQLAQVNSLTNSALDASGFVLTPSKTFTWIDKRSSLVREVVPVDTAALQEAPNTAMVWYFWPEVALFQTERSTFQRYADRVGFLFFPGGGVAMMGSAADVRESAAFLTDLNSQTARTTVLHLPSGADESVAKRALSDLGTQNFVVTRGKIVVYATPAQLAQVRLVLEALGA
ncbi:MAG: hypothetical protein KF754_05425 [Planctomycetes bacterium]|nr:hypothetical protein [Planctomycetota bacterium]